MAFYEQPIHSPPKTFLAKYIFSYDHKVIAKQFLWYGIFFLFVGGLMALMIRWALAFPGRPFPVIGWFLFPETGGVIPPDTYAMLFTMHGTIMIFYAITPLLIGAFGNFCIPLMIGARDMAFPLLNMLSFHVAVVSGIIAARIAFYPLGSGGIRLDFLSHALHSGGVARSGPDLVDHGDLCAGNFLHHGGDQLHHDSHRPARSGDGLFRYAADRLGVVVDRHFKRHLFAGVGSGLSAFNF